jgi:hypothetical protein
VELDDGRRYDFRGEQHGYAHEIIEVNRCLRDGLLESPVIPLDETLAPMWGSMRCGGRSGWRTRPRAA